MFLMICIRLKDARLVARTRWLAKENLFGFAVGAAHQRQANELVGTLVVVGFVVHHEGHEGPATARRGQGAIDLPRHRDIAIVLPLQFVGVGRRIADRAA